MGGVKEKVLAAHRAGIGTGVAPPARNEKDHLDIPEEVRKQIRVVLTDRVEQALDVALAEDAATGDASEQADAASAA